MNLKNNSPLESTNLYELVHIFMSFCSFISIINNKKINIPNIFIMVLKDDRLRSLFRNLLTIDTDYELVQTFLYIEPTLYKSKYVMKYLSKHKRN